MLDSYRKIIALLNAGERRAFFVLVVLTLVTGLIDMIGVASILPFLAVAANPASVDDHAMLRAFYEWTGVADRMVFLQLLGVLVCLIVVSSLVVKAGTLYLLTRFTRWRAQTLGVRLFERYIAQPYEWFLNHHSARLGKAILTEVDEVVNRAIQPAVRLMANAAAALFLVLFLVALEPLGALVVASLFLAFFGTVFFFIRRRLAALGRDRVYANEQRYRLTQEALTGIKEVKILGLERTYLRRFLDPSGRLARDQTTLMVYSELPRYALEAAAFASMLLFTIWLLRTRDGEIATVLPILGAYAFAGLRLFPTVQEIFKDLAQLRFCKPALNELHADLSGPRLVPPGERVEGPALHLRRRLALREVTYTYPGADRPAIDRMTLTIEANTTVGFVGSTGAGKTTVFDIILGLITPQNGALVVDEEPIGPHNAVRWQRSIGYVPQFIFIVDDTVAANIALGVPPGEIDRVALERAARDAELHDFILSLPEGYDTTVGENGVRLSGGQRQRIGIARALYRDPSVLVFDEATSALDNVTERAVMRAIGALSGQKTICIIAHRLSTVRHCDTVFVLKDGRVAGAGTYDHLAAHNEDFSVLHEAAL